MSSQRQTYCADKNCELKSTHILGSEGCIWDTNKPRRSRGKLKVERLTTASERQIVSFTFNRSLTDLELQGLATIVRQAIA